MLNFLWCIPLQNLTDQFMVPLSGHTGLSGGVLTIIGEFIPVVGVLALAVQSALASPTPCKGLAQEVGVILGLGAGRMSLELSFVGDDGIEGVARTPSC